MRMEKRRSIVGAMIEDNAVRGIEVRAIEKKEARNKRLNLLITPSLYEKAKEKCATLDISVNECVNQLLQRWIDAE